jgi:hypothetical protein
MRRRSLSWISSVLVALLAGVGCSDASDPAPQAAVPTTAPGPPLPAACEVVTAEEVEAALGAPVSPEGPTGSADRCQFVSGRRDHVEITVDRPGITGAVGAYRSLNPDAEQVPAIGDDAALRAGGGVGELVFVKGPARFFVVVRGPSSTRDAVLGVARAAAQRL